MTQRWIVGIDGSFASRAALEWAVEHASGRDASIVALQAYGHGSPTRALVAVGGHRHENGPAANALHELEAATADIVDGLDIETLVVEGSAAKALLDDSLDGSLVVVGRHGTGGRWHRMLGSVSRYCVTHARLPVVVVPSEWERHPTTTITIGFDGSAHAAAATRWAVDFADASTRVRALIAIEIAPWLGVDVVEDRLGDQLRAEEARLRAAFDQIDPSGLIEREVVVSGARPALARAAGWSDAIVLGARGAGGLAGSIVGSVSTWMLDVATCPLVIVPTRPD